MYGVIQYNEDGQVLCEVCGLYFDRVATHVRQKHNLLAVAYKKMYGFDTKKGICSPQSAEISRKNNKAHYDRVVVQNLLKGGLKSRFKEGSIGRRKDKVSEQTRLRLVSHFTKVAKLHNRKKD